MEKKPSKVKKKVIVDDTEERIEAVNWPVVITLLVIMASVIAVAFIFLIKN